jgi:hypothetical protein
MQRELIGEVYGTRDAILLARHEPPAGTEALKGQRVVELYRTPAGSCFKYETIVSMFVEDEQPEIVPISPQEGLSLYRALRDRRVALEDAFPDSRGGPTS